MYRSRAGQGLLQPKHVDLPPFYGPIMMWFLEVL